MKNYLERHRFSVYLPTFSAIPGLTRYENSQGWQDYYIGDKLLFSGGDAGERGGLAVKVQNAAVNVAEPFAAQQRAGGAERGAKPPLSANRQQRKLLKAQIFRVRKLTRLSSRHVAVAVEAVCKKPLGAAVFKYR